MYPFFFAACCGLSFRASFAVFFRICGLAKFVCICNAELNYCFPSQHHKPPSLCPRQPCPAPPPGDASVCYCWCCGFSMFRVVVLRTAATLSPGFGLLFERRPETRNLCHQLVPHSRVRRCAGHIDWMAFKEAAGQGPWEVKWRGPRMAFKMLSVESDLIC